MTELNERGRTAPFNFPIEDKSEKIIKVIGDGGGGNAVQHMWDERVKDVSFFLCRYRRRVAKNDCLKL